MWRARPVTGAEAARAVADTPAVVDVEDLEELVGILDAADVVDACFGDAVAAVSAAEAGRVQSGRATASANSNPSSGSPRARAPAGPGVPWTDLTWYLLDDVDGIADRRLWHHGEPRGAAGSAGPASGVADRGVMSVKSRTIAVRRAITFVSSHGSSRTTAAADALDDVRG